MTAQDLLLLRVFLTDAFPYQALLKLTIFLNTHPTVTNLAASECCQIGALDQAHSSAFQKSYHTRELAIRMQQHLQQTHVVTILDDDYPELLRECYRPPLILFYRGNLSLTKQPQLAVVGARKASDYAFYAIQNLLPPVIRQQIGIVSGLAMGVDSAAHRCTLESQGRPIAVIGTGLDQVYPRYNDKLQTAVSENGLLLTEYALGDAPLRWHFPLRNRIIAGLSRCVLVVEARQRSGSLITAQLATQENRNVLAVPGSLFAPLSVGCNELIQDGATPILKSADILREFAPYLTSK
ncbi:DNA-processing protein DprA [Lactobacillus selangorensis]|uniref:DNA-processing protein DprA n=1 Tax=Lactobacillus selangorensis TaxID=81857 RepID=UPI00070B62BD|nr:DNA-processing protein DprA [Lactobacillus selangorensis]